MTKFIVEFEYVTLENSLNVFLILTRILVKSCEGTTLYRNYLLIKLFMLIMKLKRPTLQIYLYKKFAYQGK